MKRVAGFSILTLFFAVLLADTAPAQDPNRGQRAQTARPDTMPMMMPGMVGMMRGMHQQMMQHPMHRTGMMVYALPALADTLGLSDEQRQQFRQRKQQFTTQQQERRQEMQAQHKQLRALFENDAQPEPGAVREQFQALADLRAEQQAARYETALQMRDVLTDEQQDALDQMEPRILHRQLMANMTVMEMMQMMRTIHGGRMGRPGMMQGMPMMRGPMHRQRMNRNRR